jgi:hypothetical protein
LVVVAADRSKRGDVMKRILWTIGMSMIGLFLGLKGQGIGTDVREVAIATIWAGAIGFGFGSIFSQRRPGKLLIFYWAATLMLVGLFFGPLLPVASFATSQALGGSLGALAGVVAGSIQSKLEHRSNDGGLGTVI